MQQIVPGVQPNHVSDALFTALGVNADTLEVVTGCGREQPKIHTTKKRKVIECVLHVCLVVMKSLSPQVLVISGQRRMVLR